MDLQPDVGRKEKEINYPEFLKKIKNDRETSSCMVSGNEFLVYL
jgi:hypothetical protein